eukprot:3924578-Alexandrium_andersonii.AAC.1
MPVAAPPPPCTAAALTTGGSSAPSEGEPALSSHRVGARRGFPCLLPTALHPDSVASRPSVAL